MCDDDCSSFKLERYKYILQEIRALNQNGFTLLALFQTLTTAILGGGVAVVVSLQSLEITRALALLAINGLLYLFTIVTMFVVISLLAGLFSWVDYRNEEVEVLQTVDLADFRSPPNVRNLWRWYETYIILFVVLVAVGVWIFVHTSVIPLVENT